MTATLTLYHVLAKVQESLSSVSGVCVTEKTGKLQFHLFGENRTSDAVVAILEVYLQTD